MNHSPEPKPHRRPKETIPCGDEWDFFSPISTVSQPFHKSWDSALRFILNRHIAPDKCRYGTSGEGKTYG